MMRQISALQYLLKHYQIQLLLPALVESKLVLKRVPTSEDDVLDVFVGVVCDVDVHFDQLAMVVGLEGGNTCC